MNCICATRAFRRPPFIPQSAAEVLRQIGACETCSTWESAAGYGALSHTEVARIENGKIVILKGGMTSTR